jgi:choline dehydrogenase-like flavoprotein
MPDPVARDALGLPRPRIAYRIDDYTKEGLAEARRIHAQLFERLNATEIGHKTDEDFQGAGHVMGTARMGADGKHAVVDANLRTFDHPNLFIEGSAVFPTGGAANPTLTIAALALRSVAAIRAALTA